MVGSNKAFVNAKEVSEMLGIGTSKAYMIIRRFNNELEQQGYLVIPGRAGKRGLGFVKCVGRVLWKTFYRKKVSCITELPFVCITKSA